MTPEDRFNATIDAAELLEHTEKAQSMARTLRMLRDTVPNHPEGVTDALGAMADRADALGAWLEGLRPVS